MTELFDKAVATVRKLPDPDQDFVATFMLLLVAQNPDRKVQIPKEFEPLATDLKRKFGL